MLLGLSVRRWSWRVDDIAISLSLQGLLVSDEPEEPFVQLRRRDGELSRPRLASGCGGLPRRHPLGRPTGDRAATRRLTPAAAATHRDCGVPVPPSSGRARAASCGRARQQVQRLLDLRRTTRSFDATRPVTELELATLLRSVWGAHGWAPLADRDMAVRKTSPSGGGLHPVEVYPFVRNVEGVEPGIYRSAPVTMNSCVSTALDGSACLGLLERATAGQWYFADADVAFVMTARFARASGSTGATRRYCGPSSSKRVA